MSAIWGMEFRFTVYQFDLSPFTSLQSNLEESDLHIVRGNQESEIRKIGVRDDIETGR